MGKLSTTNLHHQCPGPTSSNGKPSYRADLTPSIEATGGTEAAAWNTVRVSSLQGVDRNRVTKEDKGSYCGIDQLADQLLRS